MSSDQIAVVGGGLAGLLSAVNAARRGHRVVVLEALKHLGGRARSRMVGGFDFNQGPHALYLAGALNQTLADIGIAVTGGPPDLASGFALWPSSQGPLPLRVKKEPISHIVARKIDEILVNERDSYLAGGVGSPSLAQILRGIDADICALIEAFVRLSTYVHASASIDARAALAQLRLSASGTLYVDGGWGTLVNGLESVARSLGIELRTGSRVKGVRVSAGQCLVEYADGAPETFGAVILAVPPHHAASLASDSRELTESARATTPVRIVGLDLALSNLPSAKTKFALGVYEPLYFSVHSAAAKLAPEGAALIHVARYLAPNEKPEPQHFTQLERLLDRLQPGWRAVLVECQRLSGATVAWDFPRADRSGLRQPSALSDQPGVFVCGDWVGREGMLADAAAASANVAAEGAAQFI